ncbi:glycosyltransferase [Halanaerobium hydrogeniformans]|uniref:Glycosyl transferase group 1 n=1 Tax=Halanaerobium hydrogeniformans TaxID=656519 RepID=E4RNL9_HALHG|nr:glycosyltransferase [Halanaerobium hydrogeniformans]ADQ13554.1 glycosyl transferase group 1 [Halanaerobium hydrogeniformans]
MNNKNIKITYVITTLGLGGAETLLYNTLRKIDRNKFEPLVICLIEGSNELADDIENKLDIKVYKLNMKNKLDIRKIYSLYKIIKKENPDIIHSHLYAANILSRVIGKLTSAPVIISTIHNSVFGGKLREISLKFTDKFSSLNTIISDKAASNAIKMNITNKDKLKVIYNGVDVEVFEDYSQMAERKKIIKELNLENDIPILLSVGNLSKQKGYPVLFKALEKLKDKNKSFYLLIAGKGKLENQLKELVKKYDMKNEIYFLGTRRDIPQLMAAADFFVMSSHWEGLPVVLLEAMASGLPVIYTNVGGVGQVIDSNFGYLVTPDDENELADKIIEMINLSDSERNKMGEYARGKVKREYSIDNMVENFVKLYDELMQRKVK